ncbi:MAG: hypothetical protein QMD71_07770 [bacterium]|nr:hypothetical protein [bacterium]
MMKVNRKQDAARILRSVFCLLSLAGCTTKSSRGLINQTPTGQPLSPQEVKQVMESIETQSFEFELKFSKIGLRGDHLKGKFKGVKTDDKVKIDGSWKFNSTIEKLSAIGIADDEYRWINNKWEKRDRTQETQPVSYLRMVCSIGEYKFKEASQNPVEKYGHFIYEFKPNLLFMCPNLTEAYGEVWINIMSRLPEKVVAKGKLKCHSDPERSKVEESQIQWEFKFKNIGGEFEIIDPLAKTQTIKIIAKEETKTVAKILKERFELYGFTNVKYKILGDCITLKLISQNISTSLIQTLLQPGKLGLYQIAYPNQPVYQLSKGACGKEVHFVRRDSTKPVLLREKLPHKLMDTNFKLGALGSSLIELTFDEDLPSNTMIGIMVDGELIEVLPEVWGKTIEINNNKETWVKIKYPLPYKICSARL